VKTRLEKSLKRWHDIDQDLEEAELLITLSREEEDTSLEEEIECSLQH